MSEHGPAGDGDVVQNGCGGGDGSESVDAEQPSINIDSDDGRSQISDITTNDLTHVDQSERDVLNMSVTVDVGDLDEQNKQILRELASLFEENFREVVNKNRDYDFSFLRTGSKLAATDGTPFETAARSQVYGLLTRSGDKRERVIENVFGDGAAEVSDSPATTARECANYWLFIALVLSNPELADAFLEVDSTPPDVEISSR